MGRNIFRNNGMNLWDLSMTKKWKLTERISTQFRAEFFNILNLTLYANPSYPGQTTGSGQHGNPTTTGGLGTWLATPDVVTVLSDTAIRARDLDEAKALEAKRLAEETLQNRTSKADIAMAEGELAGAVAQLAAIRRLRRRS